MDGLDDWDSGFTDFDIVTVQRISLLIIFWFATLTARPQHKSTSICKPASCPPLYVSQLVVHLYM